MQLTRLDRAIISVHEHVRPFYRARAVTTILRQFGYTKEVPNVSPRIYYQGFRLSDYTTVTVYRDGAVVFN